MITNKIIQSFHLFLVFIFLLSVFLAGLIYISTNPVFAEEKDCRYDVRVPTDEDIAVGLGQAYIDGDADAASADAVRNVIRRHDEGQTWLFISCGDLPQDQYYAQGALSDAQVGAGDAADVHFLNEVYGPSIMGEPDSLHDDSFAAAVYGLWIVNTDTPGIMKNPSCTGFARDQRRSTTCRRTIANVSAARPWLTVNTDPDNPDGIQYGGVHPRVAPESPKTCDEQFNFTGGFIVCFVLGIVDSSVDSMVNAIADMLQVGRAEINDDGLKEAWSYFRNIASVLLVVIGLVMIIGQAVSKE